MKNSSAALNGLLTADAERVVSRFDLKKLEGARIMLTGAGGLVGINILATLARIADTVPGVKFFPVIRSRPSGYLAPFLGHKAARVLRGDLTDGGFLEKLPGSDLIIHAAGCGEPGRFMADPLSSLKINTLTTFKLFEKLRRGGRFLFISSSELYTGLRSREYSEDQIGATNTDHPRACYIEGKRTGETICNLYRRSGVHASSVRLSVVYGPGARPDDQRALPSFIRQGLAGGIELLDPGDAKRTLCYVSDAVELLWHVVLRGGHACYNVGGTSSARIRELARRIGKLLDAPVLVPKAGAGIAGAPDAVRLDLRRILGEYPKKDFVGLEEGLGRAVAWHKNLGVQA
ncbi:MAG: NAD-dependent epimerase/dehydratase family protein [Elusimicrobia bacterium]|nr:NAD-dependent epimerase/dehydratase family protein [Elusimicrobiota bacterium]